MSKENSTIHVNNDTYKRICQIRESLENIANLKYTLTDTMDTIVCCYQAQEYEESMRSLKEKEKEELRKYWEEDYTDLKMKGIIL